MAEIKDKVITVESLSALHDYDEKTYLPKKDPVVSGDLKINSLYPNCGLSMNRQDSTKVGSNSVTLGDNNAASGSSSYAEGNNTIARGSCQHVQGRYNVVENADEFECGIAHIVGNGGSDTNRSNAHTIDWDGNGWFAGDVYVGGVYNGVDSYGKQMWQGNPTKLVKSTNVISIEYGDELPAAGNVGRIFFKKLSG